MGNETLMRMTLSEPEIVRYWSVIETAINRGQEKSFKRPNKSPWNLLENICRTNPSPFDSYTYLTFKLRRWPNMRNVWYHI